MTTTGTRCAVDWPAFGLAPEHPCANTATVTMSLACVHEHVARSPACPGCVALMESYGPDWGCDPCLRSATPHHCPTGLVSVPLEPASDAGNVA